MDNVVDTLGNRKLHHQSSVSSIFCGPGARMLSWSKIQAVADRCHAVNDRSH